MKQSLEPLRHKALLPHLADLPEQKFDHEFRIMSSMSVKTFMLKLDKNSADILEFLMGLINSSSSVSEMLQLFDISLEFLLNIT